MMHKPPRLPKAIKAKIDAVLELYQDPRDLTDVDVTKAVFTAGGHDPLLLLANGRWTTPVDQRGVRMAFFGFDVFDKGRLGYTVYAGWAAPLLVRLGLLDKQTADAFHAWFEECRKVTLKNNDIQALKDLAKSLGFKIVRK